MRRSSKIIVGAVCASLVGAAAYFVLRPVSWQSVADRSVAALFDRRADTLAPFLMMEELKALGIDEETATKALDSVVAPALSDFTFHPESAQYWEGERQRTLGFDVTREDGMPVTVVLRVIDTGSGYKIVLSELFLTAIVLLREDAIANGTEDWRTRADVLLNGLRQLGIRGSWSIELSQVEDWPTYAESDETSS